VASDKHQRGLSGKGKSLLPGSRIVKGFTDLAFGIGFQECTGFLIFFIALKIKIIYIHYKNVVNYKQIQI
jgi:hypothetical protein